jgi:hypothetical protein
MTTVNLPPLPDEPAAHMYPADLERFKFGEHTGDAFSIAVGSPDYGKSAPLFTADQMHEYARAALASAPAGKPIPDAHAVIERLLGVLREVGDYAHDHSTGPTVPDALWEIRAMAYEADDLAASVTPPAAAGEAWQPIETAPKDGSKLLLQIEDVDHPVVGFWSGSTWTLLAEWYPPWVKFLAWHPMAVLPASPVNQKD